MKKVFAILLLLFCFTHTMFCQVLGDVNEDNAVNILDALLVAQYYVQLDPVSFTASLTTGDVNLDGSVDIVDALVIALYYVGVYTELPPSGSLTPVPTDRPTDDPGITPVPTVIPEDCVECVLPTALPGTTSAPTSAPLPAGTPAPTMVPRAGLVTFSTSDMTIKVCDSFITTAYLNTGTDILGSYTMTVSYDSDVLAVKWCVGLNGVEAGEDGFVTSVDNTTPGTLIISGQDATGTGPGTRLQLFKIHWKAVVFAGADYDDIKSTNIALSIDSLLTIDGTTLGDPGVDRRFDLVVYTGNYEPPSPW